MTVPVALPDVQNTKNGLISLSHGTVQNLSARLTGIHPASCSLYLHIGRKRPAVQSGLFRLALVRRTTSLAKRPPGEGGRFYVRAFQPSDASASEEGERIAGRRGMHLFSRGDACGREVQVCASLSIGFSSGVAEVTEAWLTMGLQAPARTVPDSRKETDWPGCRDAQVK